MKKLLAIGALALAVPAQAAVVVSFQPGPAANVLLPGLSIFETFEDEAVGSSIGSNAFVYNTNIGGIAARPGFGSTGNYGAVRGDPTGTYSVSFAASSIFSFVLGSLDDYNRLTLTFADASTQVFNGNEINNGPFENGDQVGAATNGRVNFAVVGGPNIVGASFQSIGQNSFEFDNLAIAAVPEPSTWLMMLMGFAAVGFTMRRKQNVRVSFA